MTFSAINMGFTSNKALQISDLTTIGNENQSVKTSSIKYDWSSIELISAGSSYVSANPKILADSSHNLYVVWDDINASDPSDRDVFFKFWNVTTGNWEDNETVSKNLDLDSYYPDIAFYLNDLYVVWQDKWTVKGSEDILYTHRIPSGMWVAINNLTKPNPSQIKGYPSICIGQDLTVHIVWSEENVTDSDDYDIYYSKDFHTPEKITNNSAYEATNPQIICDSDGNPHIIWQELYYPVSMFSSVKIRHTWYDEGWQNIEDISSTGIDTSCRNPKFANDSSGNIHAVWHYFLNTLTSMDSYIEYNVWDETTEAWGSPQKIKDLNSTSYIYLDIAIDSSDNIHIVYDDDPNELGDRDLFYMNHLSDATSWSLAQYVANGNNDTWKASLTIDSSDRIHIVWADESNFNNSGYDKDIFYRGLVLTIEDKGGIPLFFLPSGEAEQIPGYNIPLLIGAISVISTIIIKKYSKKYLKMKI